MKSYTLDVPATNDDLLELMIKIMKECPTDPRDTRIKLAFGNCSLLCRDAAERAEHRDSVTVWEAYKTLQASYQEEPEEETPQQEEPDMSGPEVYNYVKFISEKEETEFDLTPSFFIASLTRGVRMFFGVRVHSDGTVLDDTRRPGFLDEFRGEARAARRGQ
jgi:hypothetical protein